MLTPVVVVSPFVRTILDDADAAAVRTTIGAGTGNGNALTTSPLSQFANTTSAQLAGIMTDETGTGLLVFSIAPDLEGTVSVYQTGQSGASTKRVDIRHDGTDVFVESKDGAINILDVNGYGIRFTKVSAQLRLDTVGASMTGGVTFGANASQAYIGNFWRTNNGSGAFETFGNYNIRWPNNGIDYAADKVLKVGDGSTGNGWIIPAAGRCRVSSDVTNTGTSVAAITGISATLIASRKYSGRLILFLDNSTAAEGFQLDFNGGSATWTSFRAAIVSNIQGATLGTTQSTAIATVLNATAMNGTGQHCIEIAWAGVVNVAGTLIPRIAKNTTGGGGTLSTRTNSNMLTEDIP